MIKKSILVLFLALFAATALFAKSQGLSLTATGYEWLGYSPEEKKAFANLLHVALNKKKNNYNAEDVIKKLDDFYYSAFDKAKSDPMNFDEDEYLRIPCVKVVQGQSAQNSHSGL
jgi:hypothetical protein